jgi:hypothetical protein
MKDLTDKEYDRLDEKWTKTTPKVGPNGSGFFSQRKAATRTVPIALHSGIKVTPIASAETDAPTPVGAFSVD